MSMRNRVKREKKRVVVVPTPGKSFEVDMAERDKAADMFREMAAMGGDITVGLHADLDDEEIRRVIRRYTGVAVKFELVEHDSTIEDRNNFRHRWEAAGGPGLAIKSTAGTER